MDIMPFEFDTIHDQTIKAQFYKRQFKTKPIQSVCYDSRNKVFVVGFSHNEDPAKGTLVKMKDLTFRNDSVIAIQEDLAVWHCNDMAYDPEEHRIYIARGGDKLAVVNPDSLLVERFEPIICNAWAIARYPNGDWFIHDGDRSFKCDHRFKYFNMFTAGDTERIAKAMNIPPANTISHASPDAKGYAGYWQGAEIVNNKPYMIYTPWTQTAGVYDGCALFPCTEEDDDEIYRCETPYEVEGMCLKDGKIHFVFGNIHIGGSTWDMNEIKMKVIPGSVKSISIPANTNYAVDFSKYVPEGYELADATVQFKKGSSYLKLPYSNDAGKTILKIRQITGNKIILRSNEMIGSTSLKIIGFCKKVAE